MHLRRFACFLLIACAVGLGSHTVLAQSKDKQKTIGQPSSSATTPSLIVVNADGAKLEGNKLTLTGVQKSSIIFADRPERSAGHVLTSEVIKEWGQGDDSFKKDPPNATISVLGGKDGSDFKDAVVELKSPKLEGDNLVFEVSVLEGDLGNADGPASLFIDWWGYRWHAPAFVAGMAVGAAVTHPYYPYYHPYYPPPPPYRCGYYPYPPCY